MQKKKTKPGAEKKSAPAVKLDFGPLQAPVVKPEIMVPRPENPVVIKARKALEYTENTRFDSTLRKLIQDDGEGGISCSYCGAKWGSSNWSHDCPPFAVYEPKEKTKITKIDKDN